MKSWSIYYQHEEDLVRFKKSSGIEDSPSLLIQLFSGWSETLLIQRLLEELKGLFPHATMMGCTTDGEICCGEVTTNSIILTFILFEKSSLRSILIPHGRNAFDTGQLLGRTLAAPRTRLVLALADGLHTDGDSLMRGFSSVAPDIPIAGGLAGDNARFHATYVFHRDGVIASGVVAVAIESEKLEIFRDYNFNWTPIGRELIVTHAQGNRVYRIDGRSAVETYRYYLGKEAAERLPEVGIEFPLMIQREGQLIARAVTHCYEDGSLGFAGQICEGERVRFGHGDPKNIMDAGRHLTARLAAWHPEVILTYSCMARRRFLPEEVDREISALQRIAPANGFFTYGEFYYNRTPLLFNETMTVVAFREHELPQIHLTGESEIQRSESPRSSIRALIHLTNITAREAMMEESRHKEKEVFETLIESSPDGILLMQEERLKFCNTKMIGLFGCDDRERFLRKFLPEKFAERTYDGLSFYEHFASVLEGKAPEELLSTEWRFSRRDGEFVWMEIYITHIALQGVATLYLLFRDITRKKEIELELIRQQSRLYHQATHDSLTGLPNRSLLVQEIETFLRNDSVSQRIQALLYFDLDRFKRINDSLGHDVGDQLLKTISRRLQSYVQSDFLLARLGGDEFVIYLGNLERPEDASVYAEEILALIKKPVELGHYTLFSTASIGIALYPRDSEEVISLLKYADTAMYMAKEEGGDCYCFYTHEMTEQAYREVTLERELHHAISDGEMVVNYQPQLDVQTGRIIGVEALIRWRHPKHGMLSPSAFIDLAQKTGQIKEVDLWMMEHALGEISALKAEGLEPGKLALNITIRELELASFAREVEMLLRKNRFEPHMLELEITENDMMTKPDYVLPVLHDLYQLGVSIAIDDFGTGYSSLSQLRRLPLNKLKIDQSFVREIPENTDANHIIQAIITLAESLSLDVLAEGVEHEEQMQFLYRAGCPHQQGYLFSRPLDMKGLKGLLRSSLPSIVDLEDLTATDVVVDKGDQ